ncbi:ABC transporter permease [Rhizobiaceae bacterium BDR2-2]|uniref:ABC transporter permease n=1 Tax=Ectorhizobium quercum TaxID=2965071 RepID=A0AAE3N2D1_9HYPH|nr:ABC transporter permease [Ectorhizobium quercum]MCX8997382.1 ABC transporter permease [Ectorhizobium quercum]
MSDIATRSLAVQKSTAASRRLRRKVRNAGVPVLSALVGLVAWEITARSLEIPAYLLPAPTAVIEAMIARWPYLMYNLGYTALAALSGFFMALALGVFLGVAIAASPLVDRIVYPWLVISHAIPKVVVAPLLLVWIGFGLKSGILFVIFFTFFTIVVNTVMGLKSADPDLLHLVRSMGANRFEIMWKIKLPNALPNIFTGIKIAATLAPVGAVIGEFVASNRGLGYVLIQAVGSMTTDLAFAAVFLVSAFGVIVWYVAELIERKCLPWHASQRGQ